MSIANSDRIRKSLDILQESLASFFEREIKKEDISKDDILRELESHPNKRLSETVSNRPINEWDLSALLNTMLAIWRKVFYKILKPRDRGLILIIRDIRNEFYHSGPSYKGFSSNDETNRALDTICSFLETISDPRSKEVERLKHSLLKSTDERESKKKTEKIIGIDLGTTNSCVAIMDGGMCRDLDDREDGWGSLIRSVVWFPDDADIEKEEILVGKYAYKMGPKYPQNTIDHIKRLIGCRFDDKETLRHKKDASYSIVKADNGDASIEINGEHKSPQEISAYILSKMKRIAEQHLGEIKAAVITVPARFNNSQRQATKDAGRIAGFDVKRIINEPTAAALNYVVNNWKVGQKIAVYDFGGGTFDISIIETIEVDGKRSIKVMATEGDKNLGGMDFDQRIVDYIHSEIKKEHGVNLYNQKNDIELAYMKFDIKNDAEDAKINLSGIKKEDKDIDILISSRYTGVNTLTVRLNRSRLESLVDDLISRTVEPCRIAMECAGVSASDIDEVILVGGQTRMPKVQEVVESIFDKKPILGVDPDKAVAHGAAILGGMLADGGGSTDFEDVKYQDVTSHSLGIKLKNGKMKKLIDKGTIIPIRKSHIFTTSEDYQSAVSVYVFQGESEQAPDNELLGYFHLTGIEKAPKGEPKIEVIINKDSNDILKVSAIDKVTGKKKSIQITHPSDLSDEEIEQLTKDMELSVEDGNPMSRRMERSDIDSEVHEAKKALGEFGNQAGESEKTRDGYEDEASPIDATGESAKNLTDPNKDKDGWTPLHEDAWNGHYESVKRLINAGLDPNVTNNHGHTPLHLAAFNGHLPVVLELVNAGSDLNAKDEEGKTPLHNAAGRGHFDVIKALVKAGANINATMLNGKKPSDIAVEQGHGEIFAEAVAAAKRAD